MHTDAHSLHKHNCTHLAYTETHSHRPTHSKHIMCTIIRKHVHIHPYTCTQTNKHFKTTGQSSHLGRWGQHHDHGNKGWCFAVDCSCSRLSSGLVIHTEGWSTKHYRSPPQTHQCLISLHRCRLCSWAFCKRGNVGYNGHNPSTDLAKKWGNTKSCPVKHA